MHRIGAVIRIEPQIVVAVANEIRACAGDGNHRAQVETGRVDRIAIDVPPIIASRDHGQDVVVPGVLIASCSRWL